MTKITSLEDLARLAESVEIECKLAAGRDGRGKLPDDFWPTYRNGVNDGVSDGVNGGVNDGVNGDGLGEYERNLLEHIRQNKSITLRELAAVTGKSLSSIERTIRKLKLKHLRRVGSDKTGYWEVLSC